MALDRAGLIPGRLERIKLGSLFADTSLDQGFRKVFELASLIVGINIWMFLAQALPVIFVVALLLGTGHLGSYSKAFSCGRNSTEFAEQYCGGTVEYLRSDTSSIWACQRHVQSLNVFT